MSLLSSPKAWQSPATPVVNGRSNETRHRESRIGPFVDDRLRRIVFRRLANLSQGRLVLHDHRGRHTFGDVLAEDPSIELHVRDPRFYRRLALGGSVGAAEAYFRGHWDCDRLVELLQLFCRETTVSESVERGLARWTAFAQRFARRLQRNTLGGSRRNIAAHYDLGEDFFSLFLDETMAYSCGVFPDRLSSLREASLAKFDRVCRRLQLSDEDHVVEIGSGWGGFAVYAAEEYGCRVTTTTISQRQYEFTRRRIQEKRLEDRVTVLCQDYRNLTGQFDKLVSIEMIEAVGYEYFDTYFRTCSELLKPDGMMFLQAITIPDQQFRRYIRSNDPIKHYIFPGGCLPSLGAIFQSLGRATDMRPVYMEDLTTHYARTLQLWRQRFRANLDKAPSLGFSEEFLRLWEFYFCYCEAGFRERKIGEVQLLLRKPRCHHESLLP